MLGWRFENTMKNLLQTIPIIVAVLDTYLFCIVISKYGSQYLITFFASTSILPPPFLIQLKDKTSSISSKIFSQAKFAAPPKNIGLRLPI